MFWYGLISRSKSLVRTAVSEGRVLFKAAADGGVISLDAFSCDSENVRLALKSVREQLAIDHWQALV